jgi:integrase
MSIDIIFTKGGQRRYEVRPRDPAGKEYSRRFRTKKEAENFEATERADQSRGSWLDPRDGDVLFSKWAVDWLASNPAKSPSALARDEGIIRLHINPHIGSFRIGAVTQPKVQEIVTVWCKKAMPRTARRQYDTLRAIFNAAVDAGLLPRSPCRKIHLPGAEPVESEVVEPEVLVRIAAALGERYRLMPYIGAELGLRWGEVAGIRVCDVEFRAKRVRIRKQRTRGKGAQMVTREPKSAAGRRAIGASDELLAMIRAHLAWRGLKDHRSEELLFVGPSGAGLSYSNWYHRTWVPTTIKLGLAGLQFHDLRRTNATAMVQGGVDIKTAQHRLGHSDPRLTIGVYAQATDAADHNAAGVVSRHFRPPAFAEVRPDSSDARAFRGFSTTNSAAIGRILGSQTRCELDFLSGREGGIRTRDLSVPNAAR